MRKLFGIIADIVVEVQRGTKNHGGSMRSNSATDGVGALHRGRWWHELGGDQVQAEGKGAPVGEDFATYMSTSPSPKYETFQTREAPDCH